MTVIDQGCNHRTEFGRWKGKIYEHRRLKERHNSVKQRIAALYPNPTFNLLYCKDGLGWLMRKIKWNGLRCALQKISFRIRFRVEKSQGLG